MKCPYQTVLQQLLAYESTSSFTESWIQTPSEKWCCCLLLGAKERWTKLQKVQPIDLQLLHHCLVQMQQKHGGLDNLRRILTTNEESLHCTGDLVWYMFSSPLTTPWDPGWQHRQTAPDASPFQPVLADLPVSLTTGEKEVQLHTHFPRAPAWGQAGIKEGGNVTTRPMLTTRQAGHNGQGPLNGRSTKRKETTKKSLNSCLSL
jgi:hypothetical protein